MYIWRRSATAKWVRENQLQLERLGGDRIALIERPDRKRVQIEVAGEVRSSLVDLVRAFGGKIDKLPSDWLKRLQSSQKRKPIIVGNRKLTIPAGAAFGTGEHATTAMCLRLLTRLSREVKTDWSMVDLGTGSGILALAASCLGARRVTAIDNDPSAISTARQNAIRNQITNVKFELTDVTRRRFPRGPDILTANLFSELLIQVLPKMAGTRRLILSGILREQEGQVIRALRRSRFAVLEVKHRGKWIAILAKSREKPFAQARCAS